MKSFISRQEIPTANLGKKCVSAKIVLQLLTDKQKKHHLSIAMN